MPRWISECCGKYRFYYKRPLEGLEVVRRMILKEIFKDVQVLKVQSNLHYCAEKTVVAFSGQRSITDKESN
jgi:hypothetical protein